MAEDDVEHAFGQARIIERARQFEAGARRFLGRLDHDRATCRKRGGKFARRDCQRKIPRGEGRDRADRFL